MKNIQYKLVIIPGKILYFDNSTPNSDVKLEVLCKYDVVVSKVSKVKEFNYGKK